MVSSEGSNAVALPGHRCVRKCTPPVRVEHLVPVAAVIFGPAARSSCPVTFPGHLGDRAVRAHPDRRQLGTTNTLVLGPGVLGFHGAQRDRRPLGGRIKPAAEQRLVIFLGGAIGIIAALTLGQLPVFIGARVVPGAVQGKRPREL